VSGVYISHLDASGLEIWGESLTVSRPLIASRGTYLAVGFLGQDTVVVYHSTNRQLAVARVPGSVKSVSVSETGEVTSAYVSPDKDPLALKSYVTQLTSLGQERWTVTLPGVELLQIDQAADNSLIAAMGMRLEDAKIKTTLSVYDGQGRPLFLRDLDHRPVSAVVQHDGKRIVVASGQSLVSIDAKGAVEWKYDLGADLTQISYLGQSDHLLFAAERRSLLTLGRQGIIGVVSDAGQLLWQHRTREAVVHVGTTAVSSNIILGTDKNIHLYAPDGVVRWTLPHSLGDSIRTSTVDGRNYILHSSNQSQLLRGS
jgi:hypothetical protein